MQKLNPATENAKAHCGNAADYFARFYCGSGVGDLAQRRRQGDADSGKRQAGGGTRSGAQQEALAILLDFCLGKRLQIGDNGGPGCAGTVVCGGEAVL